MFKSLSFSILKVTFINASDHKYKHYSDTWMTEKENPTRKINMSRQTSNNLKEWK